MRDTDASRAAVANASAMDRSSSWKSSPSPIECRRYHATSTSRSAVARSSGEDASPSTTST